MLWLSRSRAESDADLDLHFWSPHEREGDRKLDESCLVRSEEEEGQCKGDLSNTTLDLSHCREPPRHRVVIGVLKRQIIGDYRLNPYIRRYDKTIDNRSKSLTF